MENGLTVAAVIAALQKCDPDLPVATLIATLDDEAEIVVSVSEARVATLWVSGYDCEDDKRVVLLAGD